MTATELSNAGYVTATELSNAGYVTTTALDTALSSYVKVSDIEDNEQVISAALNTMSDRIDDLEGADFATKSYVDEKISGITPTDMSAYVTKTELNAAAYLQADDLADYVTDSDLSSAGYITAEDVAEMGYVTESDLADYVTDTDLANASYVTNTALNTTLASYTTKADVPYKFVVLSYSDYTALGTKDPNTFYCIPE